MCRTVAVSLRRWRHAEIKTTSGGASVSVNGLVHVVVAVAAELFAIVEVGHDIVRLLRGRGRETANQLNSQEATLTAFTCTA